MLLAVDDVQWCDSASLRWLAYLVRRLEAVPVLVVATLRTGDQPDDEELLAELQLDPAALVLRPEPLSPDATTDLVGQRLGAPVSPLFATACHRTTAGNPLLLRQLLRAMESDGIRPDAAHADSVVAVGSRAVSSMVLVRLRRLGERITAVARAAAVLGDGAPLPAVAALAELPERDTAAALAALARAEVVKDEQPLAFVHPLVREAVYRDLPAAERELRHERAAEVLRAAGGTDEQVAAHLLLAPPRGDPGTVEVLSWAARTAADRGASDSAVTYLRRALAEPPTGSARRDVLVELGLVETQLDGGSSARHLLQAYGLHDDPRARADLAIAIARTHVFASPPGIATAFAREARLVVPPALADQRQALLALERIGGYMHGLDSAVWAAGPPPEPEGDGPRRPDAGRHARLRDDRRRRPTGSAPSPWPGSRTRETGSGRSTTGCSGWSPPTCGCSPTTTWATSGRGRGRRRIAGARCSPRCPPACGRGSGAGGGASCTSPWPASSSASSRTGCGVAAASASPTPAPSRSAATSTAATSPPPGGSPTRRWPAPGRGRAAGC